MLTLIIAKTNTLALRYAVDNNLHNVKYVQDTSVFEGMRGVEFDFAIGYGWREREDIEGIAMLLEVTLRGTPLHQKALKFKTFAMPNHSHTPRTLHLVGNE